MSTIIMSACWPLQGMSPAQKAVLISLSDNANDDGVCWPSITKIASRTCLSVRAVQGAVRWLCEVNLLAMNSRNGRSTIYTITPAAYAPPQEVRTADAAPAPAADAPLPQQYLHHPPADAAPRTVIEPKSEPSRKRKGANETFTVDQMLELAPLDLTEQTARDYFQFRKKRGPLNTTIWNTVLTELEECRKAGIDADKALAEAMTAGWQGFKTEWLVNRLKPAASPKQSAYTGLPNHTHEYPEVAHGSNF